MHLHLAVIDEAACKSGDLGVLTENLNLVTCPDCSKMIRTAAIKLHQRRKKDVDRLIIQQALLDNESRFDIPNDDWESYMIRAQELEEELKLFNPATAEEGFIMSLVAIELEREYERG